MLLYKMAQVFGSGRVGWGGEWFVLLYDMAQVFGNGWGWVDWVGELFELPHSMAQVFWNGSGSVGGLGWGRGWGWGWGGEWLVLLYDMAQVFGSGCGCGCGKKGFACSCPHLFFPSILPLYYYEK